MEQAEVLGVENPLQHMAEIMKSRLDEPRHRLGPVLSDKKLPEVQSSSLVSCSFFSSTLKNKLKKALTAFVQQIPSR